MALLTKEQIKEFESEEKEAEDAYNLIDVANNIAEAGDKKWAKKVYQKAEAKAEDNDDIRALAKSLYKNLGDHKWSNDLYKKAPVTKEEIKEFKVAEKEAKDSYDYKSVADEIAEVGDKDWAKKNYIKAEEKAEDFSEFSKLADSIDEYLDDKVFLKQIFQKAEKVAYDNWDLIALANSIEEKLGDKEWVKRITKKSKNDDISEKKTVEQESKVSNKELKKKDRKPNAGEKQNLINFFDSQNQDHASLSRVYVCWNQISEKEYCSGTYIFEDGKKKEGQSWNNNVISGCLEFGEASNCIDSFKSLVEILNDKEWLKYQDAFSEFDGKGKSIEYEFDEYSEYQENNSDDCELDIPNEPSYFDFLLLNNSKELKYRFYIVNGIEQYILSKISIKNSTTDLTESIYSLNDILNLIKHLTK